MCPIMFPIMLLHVPSPSLPLGQKAIKRIQDGYRNAWDYLCKAEIGKGYIVIGK